VALNGASTAAPSFTTPSHPTLLTFSLVVKGGSNSSAPDVVKVRVPSSDPTPAAIAGANQSVSAGATVSLNGSESWDPNSLPLLYFWSQTGGPAVALAGAGTATPTFTASAGPATLSFALTVSNGSQTSTASTVAVEVKAVAQPSSSSTAAPQSPSRSGRSSLKSKAESRVRLSRSTVRLKVGRSSRQVVKVLPKPARVKCVGALPKGARCRVTAKRDLVVEGTARVKRAGIYRLSVHVSGPEGTAQRPLVVRVGHSNRR
jgi:hypothetical protein